MQHGFIKAAAITPELKVADTDYNCDVICRYMAEAAEKKIKVAVFPELCITGYTCQDLFLQDELLESAKQALLRIAEYSSALEGLFFVGLPFAIDGKLYNMAAAVSRGEILGLVPKIYLPNYNEFYEARHFYPGMNLDTVVCIAGRYVPAGSRLIFACEEMPSLRIAAELCEDLWVPSPPSISHCMAGATMIVNLSASDEITGKSRYRRELVAGQSARLVCAYVYASAGSCESTQDVVYSGHDLLAENGSVLAESETYAVGITASEFDMKRLEAERRRMTTYDIAFAPAVSAASASGSCSGFGQQAYGPASGQINGQMSGRGGSQTSVHSCGQAYRRISFHLQTETTGLTRYIDPKPFVPANKLERDRRCDEIIMIQAMGLKKRLEHIGCRSAVIGISGGLDSTLALLVTVRAFDLLGLDHKGILAVTMPGFGTTDRTYENAVSLIRCIGAEFREISIVNAVQVHFQDIGQDPDCHDVTYENSQARERTQLLMDLANKTGGIVIGTGDLSELALGWATYNGDHMSMYAVNASVPKTLVRYLVQYFADTTEDGQLSATLYDVLDTPVSPELLPPEKGQISQKTEDLVGPYELHDFFIYHMLRCGSSPDKIFRLAKAAFAGVYDDEFILKWLRSFYKRFFAQHFKRSCLPDGPKVGSVALSPRGDLRMPTDACAAIWLKSLDGIR